MYSFGRRHIRICKFFSTKAHIFQRSLTQEVQLCVYKRRKEKKKYNVFLAFLSFLLPPRMTWTLDLVARGFSSSLGEKARGFEARDRLYEPLIIIMSSTSPFSSCFPHLPISVSLLPCGQIELSSYRNISRHRACLLER